jgi:enamine deaminase RidA (YjgF/YER057c/UK114 family)
MSSRRSVPARRPWDVVGYSRAIRVGNIIEVAGTTSAGPDGKVRHPGDPYAQATECLRIVMDALSELGASPSDVVRTRVFLKDITHWEDIGRAHNDAFGHLDVLPTSSFVEVSGFLDPEFLLEVEATAIIEEG